MKIRGGAIVEVLRRLRARADGRRMVSVFPTIGSGSSRTTSEHCALPDRVALHGVCLAALPRVCWQRST